MTAPTARRITPTGRLILPATADRETWLAARRQGVGSSDVPSILGIHGSQLTVWHEKLGHLPEQEQNEAMLWGHLLEDTVAQEWARRNRSVVRKVGLVAHVDEPFMRATLDRRVLECPLTPGRREACGLEVKCRNAFGPTVQWGKSGIPDDVLAQVLHQIHVTGYDHMHVAVLIGGNDYRQRTVHATQEQDTLDWVTGETRRFWTDYVARRRRPPHNGDADSLIDLEDQLWPGRDGVKHLDTEEWVDATAMLSAYAEQHAAEQIAATSKRAIQGALIQLLDGAEVAIGDDRLLYRYVERPGRTRASLDRLAERYPDAYADCVTTGQPYRVFDARLPRTKKGQS